MSLNLFDLFSRSDFESATEAKLINIRDDGAGLRILNYSDAAMYTPGSWGSLAVRTCRGIIVDSEWNVVARPWSKFFNHGQAEAGDLDLTAPVEVTDKMDGSLGIIHLTLNGVARVASRGSFESDQAIHATAVLHARYPQLASLDSVTPLVEIVYPENRIVVDYGDFDDLVLLGAVVIATGEYLSPADAALCCGWTGPVTQVFEYDTLRDALAAAPRPGMEGLCVRRLDSNHIVKIKQEEYVRLHKIVTGLSEKSVWEHMSNGEPIETMLAELPDELHEWTQEVWNNLDSRANVIECKARDAHYLALEAVGLDLDRRAYAEIAKTKAPLTPLMFQLLDGRDPRPSILKTLKPVGQTHARVISEAIA